MPRYPGVGDAQRNPSRPGYTPGYARPTTTTNTSRRASSSGSAGNRVRRIPGF